MSDDLFIISSEKAFPLTEYVLAHGCSVLIPATLAKQFAQNMSCTKLVKKQSSDMTL